MEKQREKLLYLLKRYAFKKGEFILSSGRKSSYYIDARTVTLSSEGAYLCARVILDLIKDKKVSAIGGPSVGADPILGAIATLSHIERIPIKTFIIRKELKPHGRKREIEGPDLKKGEEVILIDDVVTTGESLIRSMRILKGMGINVKEAICLVDRQEGAEENLKREGLKLISIFKSKDFLRALKKSKNPQSSLITAIKNRLQ
jgi:orotate phosphoribosyltransferase